MLQFVQILQRMMREAKPRCKLSRGKLIQPELLEPRLALATFMVTSVADSGPGTLRDAIILSNQNLGRDVIKFDLPGTDRTIRPIEELPFVEDSAEIDGTSQPGYDGLPVVKLDGSLGTPSNKTGLPISASGSSVKGLHIYNFDIGILITGGSHNYIGKNAIGADPRGQMTTSNRILGIYVFDANDNQIGHPLERNLISGNTDAGIRINGTSSRNKVQSNYIGTDVSGSAAYGPQRWGVLIHEGDSNIVGVDGDDSNDSHEGNVLSGNEVSGVRISGSASFNVVAGNIIGLSADKSQPITTQEFGVEVVYEATNTRVGTNADSQSDNYERNIISANRFDGVVVWEATNTVIQGNWIGLSGDGLQARGNGHSGIRIDNSSDSVQVGSADSENYIAGNGRYGIFVRSSTNVQLSRNMIGSAIDMKPITNGFTGISIHNSSGVMVGGLAPNQGNWIDHEGQQGIAVLGDSSRAVLRNNRLIGTESLAIDIGDHGETINDLQDTDVGPNQLQNSPTVQGVYSLGVGSVVAGSINTTPLSRLTIEILSAFEFSPGRITLSPEKSFEVTTDQSGYASWTTVLDTPIAEGQLVMAIASNGAVGTSELSNRVLAKKHLKMELNAASLAEAGGSIMATIHRPDGDSTDEPLEISLTSNSQYQPRILVPNTVTIPIGFESVSFAVNSIDDDYFSFSSIAIIANSLQGTGIVSIPLADNDSRWHNYLSAFDVNSSGNVTATDALLIINYLNSGENRALNEVSPLFPPVFYDAVFDERVAPSDALAIINFLNSIINGEGESHEGTEPRYDTSSRVEALDSLYSYFDDEVFGIRQSRARHVRNR